MNREYFQKVLVSLLRRQPFKPFTVEVNTGVRFEIDAPNAVVIREGVAIFYAPGFVPTYFDYHTVTQIIDAPAHMAESGASDAG